MKEENMDEFNFKSQICTDKVQSERLLALGLKKETADMYYSYDIICAKPYYKVMEFMNGCVPEDIFPAWSLHRLIEILDINPFIFYINCGYDTVIDHVEEYIRSGFIDTRYLEEWCLNEEE